MPGHPPKWYNRNRSIGLFISRPSDCAEVLRGRLSPKGDVYIFNPLGKGFFYESFHASGEFHQRYRNRPKEKIVPILGTEDESLGFRTTEFKLNRRPCFCLRVGKNLNSIEIKVIMKHLIRYLPEEIRSREVIRMLNEKSFFRAHLKKVKRIIKK